MPHRCGRKVGFRECLGEVLVTRHQVEISDFTVSSSSTTPNYPGPVERALARTSMSEFPTTRVWLFIRSFFHRNEEEVGGGSRELGG